MTPGAEPSQPTEPPPLADLLAMIPYAVMLGMELVSVEHRRRWSDGSRWREELCTIGGALHGGALMSLADNLGGLCAYLSLPAGAGTATISSSTNFMRGVREGHVDGHRPTAPRRPIGDRRADRSARRRRPSGRADHPGAGGHRALESRRRPGVGVGCAYAAGSIPSARSFSSNATIRPVSR